MELIEQDWVRAADAEQSGGGAEDTNGTAQSGETGASGERLANDPLNQWKTPFKANQEKPYERRMMTNGSSNSPPGPYHHNQQGGRFGSDQAF
jgi:hypothetical protein